MLAPAATFVYPPNATDVRVLGYGSLSADGFFPQLHADDLSLLPQDECTGLTTAYGRWWAAPQSVDARDIQACTGVGLALRGVGKRVFEEIDCFSQWLR